MSKPTDPAEVAAEQLANMVGVTPIGAKAFEEVIRAAYAERDKALREALEFYASTPIGEKARAALALLDGKVVDHDLS